MPFCATTNGARADPLLKKLLSQSTSPLLGFMQIKPTFSSIPPSFPMSWPWKNNRPLAYTGLWSMDTSSRNQICVPSERLTANGRPLRAKGIEVASSYTPNTTSSTITGLHTVSKPVSSCQMSVPVFLSKQNNAE